MLGTHNLVVASRVLLLGIEKYIDVEKGPKLEQPKSAISAYIPSMRRVEKKLKHRSLKCTAPRDLGGEDGETSS